MVTFVQISGPGGGGGADGSPGALLIANNLSDLGNAGTARTSLGLGSSATHASSDYLLAANNLSDVTSGTARTNLGLGSSATHASSDYLLAANNLSDVTAATARTNLGLGAIATATGALFSQAMSAVPTQSSAGLTTTLGGGSPVVADTSIGVRLTAGNASGAFLYGDVPVSTPYTIRALVIPAAVGGAVPLLGWSDGTKTQIGYATKFGEANVGLAFVISYSSVGVFNATHYNTAHGVAGNLLWQEINDDGTTVTFRVSTDGINYANTYSVAKASGYLGASGYTKWCFGVNQGSYCTLVSLTKY
jgi:hypothetical protein